jgi:hypothetical protein
MKPACSWLRSPQEAYASRWYGGLLLQALLRSQLLSLLYRAVRQEELFGHE